jgi:hypothetical protein
MHEEVCNGDVSFDYFTSKCDHFKDKSLLVELPCEVGCEVWFADKDNNSVWDGMLISFSLDASHLWFNCRYKCGLNYWHTIEDFGKTVFLTKEDAEAKLKEIEGK